MELIIYILPGLLLLSHFCVFQLGRRLGQKEGIDYCFDMKEKELKESMKKMQENNYETTYKC